MKIIDPYVLIPGWELDPFIQWMLDRYARICYKSVPKDHEDLSVLKQAIKNGHESVIEHEKATVIIVCDRGVSHEIVRHRIAAYSQESTRYCNYSKDKHGKEITVIRPFGIDETDSRYPAWEASCVRAEVSYMDLLKSGHSAQWARSVLPNSLKTEIVVTYNIREWRHFFKLRCAADAHPQMQQIAIPLLLEFKKALPVLFEDIQYNTLFDAAQYAKIKYVTDLYFDGEERLK